MKIKDVVIRSNGDTTANLTSAGVYAGTGQCLVLIDPTRATLANLAHADYQEPGVGPWTLGLGGQIWVNLVGTGPVAVDLTLDIEFECLAVNAHLY
jgi:hypothetical protein